MRDLKSCVNLRDLGKYGKSKDLNFREMLIAARKPLMIKPSHLFTINGIGAVYVENRAYKPAP